MEGLPSARPLISGGTSGYLNPAGAMMAAPITIAGATLDPGAPVLIFPTRIFGGGADNGQGRQYDVASTGAF